MAFIPDDAPDGIRAAFAGQLKDVYFLEAEGMSMVKIGEVRSGQANSRRAALQTGCPAILRLILLIEDAGPTLEAELHKRFSKHRVHHEWFRLDREIIQFIEEKKAAQCIKPST